MSAPGAADVLGLITAGEIRVEGRLVDASNTTLFATVTLGDRSAECVYKPVSGERPLWDFPDGTLAGREVAAHLVSEATGWSIVPPTVLREGPFGVGMVQLWMDVDPDVNLVDIVSPAHIPAGWLRVLDASGPAGEPVSLVHADDDRLRRMAVLDVVINNGDRKGGHVLPTPDGRVYGVDHGVAFSVEDKLRTVLWGWAGAPLTTEEAGTLTEVLGLLDADLGDQLRALLMPAEVAQVRRRIRGLLRTAHLPAPGEGWPSIPWPPF
jgi:uncharacterized repeat protein (TIGR03843 family)